MPSTERVSIDKSSKRADSRPKFEQQKKGDEPLILRYKEDSTTEDYAGIVIIDKRYMTQTQT